MMRNLRRAYWLWPLILQFIAWLPVRILLAIFCRFEVKGRENLISIRQAIFAANHSSELDPIILRAALPLWGKFSPLFYVAAPSKAFDSEEFGWRRHLYSVGWFFRAWGAYPTTPGHKNYAISLQHHLAILREGGSVCIFPEGGISKTGTLGEGKGGVAFLSHCADVSVVPVAIIGVFDINLWRFLNPFIKITVIFGEPSHAKEHIPNSDPEVEHFRNAARQFMSRISDIKEGSSSPNR